MEYGFAGLIVGGEYQCNTTLPQIASGGASCHPAAFSQSEIEKDWFKSSK
jgi:hypothetical protein